LRILKVLVHKKNKISKKNIFKKNIFHREKLLKTQKKWGKWGNQSNPKINDFNFID
jgi:hypothetical protein